jgi:hypothetical protein
MGRSRPHGQLGLARGKMGFLRAWFTSFLAVGIDGDGAVL